MTAIQSHDTRIEQLLASNSGAAEVMSRTPDEFDKTGADLIMRNLAVVTDRISATEFAALPKDVQDQVRAVAFMADDIAPLDEADTQRLPDEEDATYDYRVGVWARVHSLQTLIHTGRYDSQDKLLVSKLKFAVQGAGAAFASVIEATRGLPAIAETIGYFEGNTRAAAKSAARLAIDTSNQE